MRKTFLMIYILLGLYTISARAQTQDNWISSYFRGGSIYSCLKGDLCQIPTIEKLERIKIRFKENSNERVQFLQKIQEGLDERAQLILGVPQSFIKINNESLFFRFYTKVGSELQTKIDELRIDEAKLLVSQSSPMIDMLSSLQELVREFKNKLYLAKKNSKAKVVRFYSLQYKNFLKSKDFQGIFRESEKVIKRFFFVRSQQNKEEKVVNKLIKNEVSIIQELPQKNCSQGILSRLEGLIGTAQVSSITTNKNEIELYKNSRYIQSILDGLNSRSPMQIVCKESKRAKAKIEREENILTILYQVKNGSKSLFDAELPTRKEIRRLLK